MNLYLLCSQLIRLTIESAAAFTDSSILSTFSLVRGKAKNPVGINDVLDNEFVYPSSKEWTLRDITSFKCVFVCACLGVQWGLNVGCW